MRDLEPAWLKHKISLQALIRQLLILRTADTNPYEFFARP